MVSKSCGVGILEGFKIASKYPANAVAKMVDGVAVTQIAGASSKTFSTLSKIGTVGGKVLGAIGSVLSVADVIISWSSKSPNREQAENIKE